MSELGQTLRTAREELGLSLEQVQEATKIRKQYLIAIEEGNYSALPGSFYVRAFVKNYAESVGLNPEELLSYYKHELPSVPQTVSTEPAAVSPPPRKASSSRSSSERFSKLGFSLLMWAFLGLIVVLIWIFVIDRSGKAPVTDGTPLTTSTPGPNVSGDPASGGSVVTPASTPDVTPTPTPTPTPPPGAVTFDHKSGRMDYYKVTGTMTLDLKFSGEAWFEVRKGGRSGSSCITRQRQPVRHCPSRLMISFTSTQAARTTRRSVINGQVIDDGDRPSTKRLQFEPVTDADGATGGDNVAQWRDWHGEWNGYGYRFRQQQLIVSSKRAGIPERNAFFD